MDREIKEKGKSWEDKANGQTRVRSEAFVAALRPTGVTELSQICLPNAQHLLFKVHSKTFYALGRRSECVNPRPSRPDELLGMAGE